MSIRQEIERGLQEADDAACAAVELYVKHYISKGGNTYETHTTSHPEFDGYREGLLEEVSDSFATIRSIGHKERMEIILCLIYEPHLVRRLEIVDAIRRTLLNLWMNPESVQSSYDNDVNFIIKGQSHHNPSRDEPCTSRNSL